MNILVVDDNDVSLTMISATLRAAGYQVLCASDGREAMRRVESGDVSMIVTDWEMPYLSGIDLCRQVRAAGLPRYVYVVLVTSHNSPAEVVDGLSAGADDFIGKPFHPAELIARVRAGERILALETRDVTIFALAKLAESRDPETGAHLERVRGYCRVLAQDLAAQQAFARTVDAEFIHLIYLTSPLHDIGKVGIPDSVLLKPGRLCDREFEIMKSHARLGADTLNAALQAFPNVRFLEMARDIAATHHERWDGSGYPSGFAGDNIPLAGRIMAVADVYDALTSKRVYKGAFTHEVARELIVKDSGTHFDPALVAAFRRVEERFIEIRASFDEPHSMAA